MKAFNLRFKYLSISLTVFDREIWTEVSHRDFILQAPIQVLQRRFGNEHVWAVVGVDCGVLVPSWKLLFELLDPPRLEVFTKANNIKVLFGQEGAEPLGNLAAIRIAFNMRVPDSKNKKLEERCKSLNLDIVLPEKSFVVRMRLDRNDKISRVWR